MSDNGITRSDVRGYLALGLPLAYIVLMFAVVINYLAFGTTDLKLLEAIFQSPLTTLVTAVVMFYFGSKVNNGSK